MTKKTNISVLLPTFNNEQFIQNTLESIKWADEIVIVDSYSNDKTLEICKEYGAKIYQNKYINSANQKNWALQFLNNEWVFQIDSDEVLNSSAEKEIQDAISKASPDVKCFQMERRNHVLGKWVKHGGLSPDYQTRLLNKNHCKWNDQNVHSKIITKYKISTLKTPIFHFGVKSISQPLKNLNRYTRYESEEMIKKGINFSYFKLICAPFYIFLKNYLFLMGFRDGWRGIFLALYTSFYVFIKHLKRLEIDILEKNKNLK